MTTAPHAVCYGVVGWSAAASLRRHAALARGVNQLWLAVPASPVTTRHSHKRAQLTGRALQDGIDAVFV